MQRFDICFDPQLLEDATGKSQESKEKHQAHDMILVPWTGKGSSLYRPSSLGFPHPFVRLSLFRYGMNIINDLNHGAALSIGRRVQRAEHLHSYGLAVVPETVVAEMAAVMITVQCRQPQKEYSQTYSTTNTTTFLSR